MTAPQPPSAARVEFVSTDDWNAATERAVSDPAYTVADDPRCLYGWGPPDCEHRFGHACERPVGHRGRCMPNIGDLYRLPCEARQRPKRWDAVDRAEANR